MEMTTQPNKVNIHGLYLFLLKSNIEHDNAWAFYKFTSYEGTRVNKNKKQNTIEHGIQPNGMV